MLASLRKYAWRGVRSFTAPAYDRYSGSQKLLHWGVAALCLAQVPTSWAIQRTHMAHGLMRPSETDLLLHDVHAWTGWTILALVAVRLLVRVQRNGPGLPAGSKLIYRYGAAASHACLYGLLLALPVTGTLQMYIGRGFGRVHSMLAWTLLGLVGLHVAAAIWHQFILRDGGLPRILPGLAAPSSGKTGPRRSITDAFRP